MPGLFDSSLSVAPVQTDHCDFRRSDAPNRGNTVGESLRLVRDDMGQAQALLAFEHVFPMIIVKPGWVTEFHGDAKAFHRFHANSYMFKIGSPVDEPWRKLKQHDAQLAGIDQGLKGGTKAEPEFAAEFFRSDGLLIWAG